MCSLLACAMAAYQISVEVIKKRNEPPRGKTNNVVSEQV